MYAASCNLIYEFLSHAHVRFLVNLFSDLRKLFNSSHSASSSLNHTRMNISRLNGRDSLDNDAICFFVLYCGLRETPVQHCWPNHEKLQPAPSCSAQQTAASGQLALLTFVNVTTLTFMVAIILANGLSRCHLPQASRMVRGR